MIKTLNKYKLDGFTLMELLIVLILLSVIVSMGLLVVNLVRNSFDRLNNSQLNLTEIQNNDMAIDSYFFNSDSVFFVKEDRILQSLENELSFRDSKVISTSNQKTYFDSIYDISIHWFFNEAGKKLVSKFCFSSNFEGLELPFTYVKNYDIATLINYPLIDSLHIK